MQCSCQQHTHTSVPTSFSLLFSALITCFLWRQACEVFISPKTSFMFQTFKQRVLSRLSLAVGLHSQPERSWNIYLSEHKAKFLLFYEQRTFLPTFTKKASNHSPNEIIFSQGKDAFGRLSRTRTCS